MEPKDSFRNVPLKEQNSSSSDDDDLSPLRKRIKVDSVSDDDSTQGEYETFNEQHTQETGLTGASWDAAEASESVTGNGDQKTVLSIATDDNNNDSLAIDQNTHELQTEMNDSVSDDTKPDSAMNLESTLEPETRYVIPQNLLYRPSIGALTTDHKIPNSANETKSKHDKPIMENDISSNIEQIRQAFIRSWNRILEADDLIPEPELATLNSTVSKNIGQYLDDQVATNSTNEGLRELIPRVRDEIRNLQQRDEFQSVEPEPEPIPLRDFLTDPLDLLESTDEHAVTGPEFDFSIRHWNRIQQAFVIPEQLPGFDELFTNSGILIPNHTQDGSPNDDTADLTNVPNELAHIYNTIIREAAGNQQSNVSTPGQSAAKSAQSQNPNLRSYVDAGSNSRQPNYEADLYRSLLGIPSPFERNGNIPNEPTAAAEHDLNRSVVTRVPQQNCSSLSQVEPNTAEFDPTLHSTPVDVETISPEIRPNASEIATPLEMEINPAAFDTNPIESNTRPAEGAPNRLVFESNWDQEDSDASTPSGSDADDGEAQFVVVPRRNNFKPLKIVIFNPDALNASNVNTAPTQESTSGEIAGSAQEPMNVDGEVGGIDAENYLAIQEMNHFDNEMNTIETEINVITEEADRFEQQAARFEGTAGEFQEVESFFRQISGIFEFAALSLQEAVDNFESTSIEEASDIVNELDPLSEGIAVEGNNETDQEVPDIEPNDS